MAKPKLTYFDFPGGRGEDCRMALHIAGVDFEDDRVTPPTWPDRREQTPFGALPVLEIPGQEPLAQSNAILRFVGQRHELHPTDPHVAARHEAIMCSVEDVRARVSPNPSLDDEEKKRAFREDFANGYLKRWAANVEAQLEAGPFLAGDRLNVADLKLHVLMKWFVSGGVDHVPKSIFDPYPKLTALYEAVRTHPKVAQWSARFSS